MNITIPDLSAAMLALILSHLSEARDFGRAALVSKAFRDAILRAKPRALSISGRTPLKWLTSRLAHLGQLETFDVHPRQSDEVPPPLETWPLALKTALLLWTSPCLQRLRSVSLSDDSVSHMHVDVVTRPKQSPVADREFDVCRSSRPTPCLVISQTL